MVTGRIVECDPEGPLFFLPKEHAAYLTRESTPNNIAVFAQYISQLGEVENRIIDCFKKGGGLPDQKFDLITAFDAIHDQAQPDVVLSNIANAVRSGGTFLMQNIAASSHVHKNIDHPVGPLFYTISCLHCMSVSLSQNGAGLGAMWGEEKAVEMLHAAGFKKVEIKKLPHDFQNNFFIIKKD